MCFCKENTPNVGDRLLKMGLKEFDVHALLTELSRCSPAHPPSDLHLLITFGSESLISWRTCWAAASVSPCSAPYRWLITPNYSPPPHLNSKQTPIFVPPYSSVRSLPKKTCSHIAVRCLFLCVPCQFSAVVLCTAYKKVICSIIVVYERDHVPCNPVWMFISW